MGDLPTERAAMEASSDEAVERANRARARGLAQAIATARHPMNLDGVREIAAEIVALLALHQEGESDG
jgi:hypothetical protein